jgi:signal transduction histidine kinase
VAARRGIDTGLGILTTRIGRRFVGLFLVCAMLPLVAFAWITLSHVSAELQLQTARSLHDAAKTAGMGVAARLGLLASDFELLREAVRLVDDERGGDAFLALTKRLRQRAGSAWLVEPDRQRRLWGDGDSDPPVRTLGDAELAHLGTGKVLLRCLDDSSRLAAFARCDPDRPAPWLVLEPRRDWLWDPEELRGSGAEVAIFDGSRRVLYHSFGQAPDTESLWTAVGGQPASGSFGWRIAGVPHLARYWRAFLRPQYGIDLLIVQSRADHEVLAAVRGFETWFVLIAVGALLCVLFASLVQMRRTLGPIVSLREATRRVAGGDFAVRVPIHGDDEFGDLATTFNQMTAELAENVQRRERTERELVGSRDAALAAVRAKAEFVTNVSHEFRTPMAQILGASEILAHLDGNDPEALREFADITWQGAQRLAGLVDDVLELGDTAAFCLERVDLGASIAASIAALPPKARGRVSVVAEAPPAVHGDARRLSDAFRRLLDNAAKFSDVDAPIDVRVRRVAGTAVVEFVDRGVGIAAADLGAIFEPFRQVGRDQLTDKATGTGLGLTLAKSTIERHGGRIEVESTPGHGSTFRVVLPAIAEVASASAR